VLVLGNHLCNNLLSELIIENTRNYGGLLLSIAFYGFLSALLSFSFMGLFIKRAKIIGLLDQPNNRSSHFKPTVRGGGFVFSLVYLLFGCFLFLYDLKFQSSFQVVLIACPLALFVGWYDDRFNLSAVFRLIFQLFLSVIIIFYVSDQFKIEMKFLFLPSYFWLNFVFSILFITWFTNLFNFMDGADGLAASTSVIASIAMAILALKSANYELTMAYILVGSCLLGFLPWNWSPAKIFMGESGSYFLGINFAILALIGNIKFKLSMYAFIILFGLFIVDTTYTLIVRIFRRQNPLAPHKHFAFHKLMKKGWSHNRISILYSSIVIFWLAPLALSSFLFQQHALLILVLSYTPLVVYVWKVKAGID
jgi:Fuc2NAc and GlcNAc transferase